MNKNAFRIHEIQGYIETIILLEYEHGILLFDSGCVNDVKRIERYFKQVIKRPLTDIKLMAVTHMHPDHGGGAVRLREKYAIPVAAHEDVDKWYAGIGGWLQHKFDCIMATSMAIRLRHKPEKVLYPRQLTPDYLLKDGEKLPIFSEWVALHVPGHIMHDMVFYNQAQKVIYTADLTCDVKGKIMPPVPILLRPIMAASYKRLAQLEVQTILRGHGSPIITDNAPDIFLRMKEMLNNPANSTIKRVKLMSVYSPEYRRKLQEVKE